MALFDARIQSLFPLALVVLTCTSGAAGQEKRSAPIKESKPLPKTESKPVSAPSLLPSDPLSRADQAYRAGDWETAVAEYQTILDKPGKTDALSLRRVFDRTVEINARLGRHEQAVRHGLNYQKILTRPDDKGTLREVKLRIGDSYLFLGHNQRALQCTEEALVMDGLPPLHPVTRILALTNLARIWEKRGDRNAAARYWRQAEEFGRQLIGQHRKDLGKEDLIQCSRRLADCYRFTEEPDKAIDVLTPLLEVHDDLNDAVGKQETLRILAMHHLAKNAVPLAIEKLREALAIHKGSSLADRLRKADLLQDLGIALGKDHEEGVQRLQEATLLYDEILKAEVKDRRDAYLATLAFWNLQTLHQRSRQYQQALQLAEAHAESWTDDAWFTSRLKAEQAGLHILLGASRAARPLLEESIRFHESQDPQNLSELVRALNSLAVAELTDGSILKAETLGKKCQDLYKLHSIPDDDGLIESYNLLGTSAAARAEYAQAIELFQKGEEICRKLGSAADRPLGNILLNVAQIHRSQGDIDEAIKTCRAAHEIYCRFEDPDALGHAGFQSALASMLALRHRFEESETVAKQSLELCRKHGVQSGPLVVSSTHCLALARLNANDVEQAEALWNQLLVLQQASSQNGIAARTLNYLGIAAEKRGQPKIALEKYRQALDLQNKTARSMPVAHFITLWRLANLSARDGKKDEARDYLEQAIDVVEKARSRTYGADKQRAEFFKQFEPGFDQLVDWSTESGRIEKAFQFAERGRSRSFLDQLQFAGADPRASLKGERGEELRKQEQELRERINAIRARALMLSPSTEGKEAESLLKELETAQQEYTKIWLEVLSASPMYRGLASDEKLQSMRDRIREKVLGPDCLMVLYYIGRERSHLLLLGDRSFTAQAFSLEVPSAVVDELRRQQSFASPKALASSRGMQLQPRGTESSSRTLKTLPPNAKGLIPLTREIARLLVDDYRRRIDDPSFTGKRGFTLTPKTEVGEAIAKNTPRASTSGIRVEPDTLANLLLPPVVRAKIRERAPRYLIVVPDGALHKLPFEALVTNAGSPPRFVIDDLPPLVYAPSATALAVLAERQDQTGTGPHTLLSIGNPAYPQSERSEDAAAVQRMAKGTLLGLRGEMPLLPFTGEECRRIGKLFAENAVILEGEQASERNLVSSIADRRILHIAAHGFADERFGNLFGALALTPPAPGTETSDNDGLLSLHEICALPLSSCELAVLSACSTNVGPQQPLEAGVTLASAFLTAGVHRVVASHWSVDDKSTAELMETFFEEIKQAESNHQAVNYALALQNARLKVRNSKDWSAPFYWAPFVLLGPAEDTVPKTAKR
ncbi:MAG: CHAT domain-containing tetratricopeptide repeat protein [Planctomycetota bacterium]